MFQVAMLSKWHVHAPDYARQIGEFGKDRAKITCVWDEEPARGQKWAEELGVDFEPELSALLNRKDVDGVVVDTPTSLHPEVMLAAARAGKHIFTEKVLALRTADAVKIAEEVKKQQVKFCISYPQRTRPAYLFAKEAVDKGYLGKPTMMRVQNGHDGASSNWLPDYWYDAEKAGGGAMMDLGCHPMYLARYILGEPEQINSMFTYFTNREVEDSAVCTITFQNGALAVVESSLAVKACPYQMEIFGTEGSILIREEEVRITSPQYGGKTVVVKELPAPLPSAMEQWLDACTGKGTGEIFFGLEDAVSLSEMMEGAYLAAKEKRTVSFSEIQK